MDFVVWNKLDGWMDYSEKKQKIKCIDKIVDVEGVLIMYTNADTL